MTWEANVSGSADLLNRTAQPSLNSDQTILTDNLSLEHFGGAILPVQYFDLINRRKFLNGERRLLLAVLEEALRTYLSNLKGRSREQRIRFAEVHCWFYSPCRPQSLFAFESVCDLLGIAPGILRTRLTSISLRDLPSRHLRGLPPVAYRHNHAPRRQHGESSTLSSSRKSRTPHMKRAAACALSNSQNRQ